MVRDARPEDAGAIARVHTKSWQVGYAHAFPAEALANISTERRRENMARWIGSERPRTAVLVAETEGAVVGFASVGPSRDHDSGSAGELYAIYVEPASWGAGIGQQLIAAAEERLRVAGFPEATLWVLGDNPRARRFYEAAGWALDGATKQEVHLGVEVTEVRYRKRLPDS
jgi:GNAT superfamily N-acetyltransferase